MDTKSVSEVSTSAESGGMQHEQREGARKEQPVGGGGGFPFLAEARHIPYRMQQVLISWVFITASAALLLDFASLQDLLQDPADPSFFAELCNWFGVLSCICWLQGFILLAHWLHSVGATRLGLAGCYLKLVAALFFNLQPMTGTMNDPLLAGGFPRGGGAGLWWSNLLGILLFHSGNLVSCADFFLHTPPGADTARGWLYHGNLPITGMWVYQAATWFLTAANFFSCSFDGAAWAPLVATTAAPVFCSQCLGGGLLLLGSLIYTAWCGGFHDFSNPPLGA